MQGLAHPLLRGDAGQVRLFTPARSLVGLVGALMMTAGMWKYYLTVSLPNGLPLHNRLLSRFQVDARDVQSGSLFFSSAGSQRTREIWPSTPGVLQVAPVVSFPPLESRPLDLVVFAATGDVGSAACRFLYHHGRTVGIHSWAPAARDLSKLKQLVQEPLYAAAPFNQDSGVAPNEPIRADLSDMVSMQAMARQARVVLATAGPYQKYGEEVIVACISTGTHYVDVTGEVEWVSRMKEKYGHLAQQAGVSIVSFAGYDSVPFEMSSWLLAHALQEEKTAPKRVECFASSIPKGSGAMPTGTVNTFFLLLEKSREDTLANFGLKKQQKEAEKENVQITEALASLRASAEKANNCTSTTFMTQEVAEKVRRDLKANGWIMRSQLAGPGIWTGPHIMMQINAPVVHISATAQGFDFEYRERAWIGMSSESWSKEVQRRDNPFTVLAAVLGQLVTNCLVPILALPVFQSLVRSALTGKGKDNQGKPSLNAIQKMMNKAEYTGFTDIRGFAINTDGTKLARSILQANWDAGIGFTVLSSTAVAGALAQQAKSIAQSKPSGFLTPLCALGGPGLRNALTHAGIILDIETETIAGAQGK